MNIEQAKSIQLFTLLDKMGFKPTPKKGNEYLYYSPFRNEKTPSFRVNTHKNVWFDFGEATGGDTVEFVRAYLKSIGKDSSVSESLKWLDENFDNLEALAKKPDLPETAPKSTMILRDVQPISRQGLIAYLKKRGIPLEAAKLYLKELRVYFPDSGKTIIALGLKNENRGYELRNPGFKGSFPPKGITFIRGTTPKPPAIHIFEGLMDFLSIIANEKGYRLTDDTIILNSTSNIEQVLPYIQGYGYRFMRSWMDNDTAGRKATKYLSEFAKTEEGLTHRAMNFCYKPHKDVNAWHMHKSGLPTLS